MTNYDIDELERQGLRTEPIKEKMRYDFFDLESQIQNVWQTKDDLDSITGRLYDDAADGPMTEDEIGNVLVGLSELHETRCKKLWKVFEAILSQNRARELQPPVPLCQGGATADNNEITRETSRDVKLDNEGDPAKKLKEESIKNEEDEDISDKELQSIFTEQKKKDKKKPKNVKKKSKPKKKKDRSKGLDDILNGMRKVRLSKIKITTDKSKKKKDIS